MVKELYQITVQKWRYFTHFTNYIEWCCYISALFYVSSYLEGQNIFKRSMALWPLATTVILLSYTSLILFLRRFTYSGIYISMFIEVTKTLFKVLIIFTPIIFAFSLAFFLLLKEQVGLAVGDIDSIQRNANMRRLAMQVEFATDIDQRYPRWLRGYFQRSVLY
ncbi:Transient receptor putative cation channel sub A member 1 [Desmophyllum pertusum]|uniref:Transient receptor putative cation channel sub A member 1 n=1 Tax=Desmophyllum pertusum TaxID=174260 RepID=A0A9W9ZUF1_9CNID|nr:Transient receptor putative cation channel sub A member 1 [Desmophyllum pertusum]